MYRGLGGTADVIREDVRASVREDVIHRPQYLPQRKILHESGTVPLCSFHQLADLEPLLRLLRRND